MSNANHTPGPWAVLKGYDGSIEVASSKPVRINLTTAGTVIVSRVCAHDDAEHFSAMANAHLIAAAPELLEALIDVSNQARHSDYDWPVDLARAVSAASAKATGEQA